MNKAKITQPLDDTGYPMPERAVGFWGRRAEVQDILNTVAAIKTRLKSAKENKDLLFCEVNFNSVMADLNRLRAGLSLALPYAVCPSCQSQLADTCKLCAGRGVISKFRFDVVVPMELKKIREASCIQ
jgi:hypothetical protein